MKPSGKWFGRVLPTLVLLLPLTSHAMPTVYRSTYLNCGDTCYVSDINDRGDIVTTGFGDSGGMTFLLKGSDYLGKPLGDSLRGDHVVLGLDGTSSEVIVNAIDNQGNMAGTVGFGPNATPVVWINDVPHDMTDPANAGISVPVRTSKDVSASFFDSLTILGMPTDSVIHHGLMNDAGQFVVAFRFPTGPAPLWDSYWLLTQVVPEPASLLLISLGLGGLVLTPRRRSKDHGIARNPRQSLRPRHGPRSIG